jgi:hypothetical protein
MQNKLQIFTMTVPRIRSRKGKNNPLIYPLIYPLILSNDREEITERRLPGDDLYLPPEVN